MAQIGAKIKLFRKFSGLRWQTALTALIECKRVFAALTNLSPRHSAKYRTTAALSRNRNRQRLA
jgi:hypothetical protein